MIIRHCQSQQKDVDSSGMWTRQCQIIMKNFCLCISMILFMILKSWRSLKPNFLKVYFDCRLSDYTPTTHFHELRVSKWPMIYVLTWGAQHVTIHPRLQPMKPVAIKMKSMIIATTMIVKIFLDVEHNCSVATESKQRRRINGKENMSDVSTCSPIRIYSSRLCSGMNVNVCTGLRRQGRDNRRNCRPNGGKNSLSKQNVAYFFRKNLAFFAKMLPRKCIFGAFSRFFDAKQFVERFLHDLHICGDKKSFIGFSPFKTFELRLTVCLCVTYAGRKEGYATPNLPLSSYQPLKFLPYLTLSTQYSVFISLTCLKTG